MPLTNRSPKTRSSHPAPWCDFDHYAHLANWDWPRIPNIGGVGSSLHGSRCPGNRSSTLGCSTPMKSTLVHHYSSHSGRIPRFTMGSTWLWTHPRGSHTGGFDMGIMSLAPHRSALSPKSSYLTLQFDEKGSNHLREPPGLAITPISVMAPPAPGRAARS